MPVTFWAILGTNSQITFCLSDPEINLLTINALHINNANITYK